jgi:two-component system, response regulator PdtaR
MKKEEPDKHLRGISEVSRAIASDLYLEDILRLIVTVTAEVLNSKICSILLVDEEKKELVIRATQSVSETYNYKPHLRLGEGIGGRVAKEKKAIAVLDVKSEPNYLNLEIAKKEGLASLLSVPMMVKGRVIGVINVYTSRPHNFTPKEAETLASVANQAAVAIENAQLLIRTKVVEEELKTRKLVERAKALIMKEHGLTEEDAFKRIQKRSMDSRKSMREIAEAIILAKNI